MKYLHSLFEKIPREEIRKQIEYLRKINLDTIEINDLVLLLNKLMIGYSFSESLHKQIPKEVGIPYLTELVFRARINNPGELFSNISELIYPPAKIIRKYGRLNDKYESIFYGANIRSTSITEIRPNVGDFVTVIEFKILDPANFQFLEVGIIEKIMKNPIINTNLSAEAIHKNNLIRNFLVDEITKIVEVGQEHLYKISIAISKIFFKHKAGVIYYPSITREFKRINIAIRPDIFQNKLKPNKGWLFKIDEIITENNFKYSPYGEIQSISKNGKISWIKY